MEEIKITEENVKELWRWYESYLSDFHKRYYDNVKAPYNFEEYVEHNIVKCECCGELVDEEYISNRYDENICEDCINNGYGE